MIPKRALHALALIAGVQATLSVVLTGGLQSFGVPGNAYAASFANNVTHASLQLLALTFMVLNAKRSQGQRRAFWVLMAVGSALWLTGQGAWIYYENLLHSEFPLMSVMDIVFFLHVVPMIAAAAVQPHAEPGRDDVRFQLGYFDLCMLLLFWVFLYGFIIYPYQYIQPEAAIYGPHFNLLYLVENVVVVLSFAALWWRTRQQWRSLYRNFCISAALYMAGSAAANQAIDRGWYVSGGIFDIPLTLAMCWFAYAAIRAYAQDHGAEAPVVSPQQQIYWHSGSAAMALLAMPVLAGWAMLTPASSPAIQRFRVVFTLVAMALMLVLFVVKQMVLDRRLMALVRETRAAYEDLQKLQGHLLQAEKLAAIGRLVAGAAHEINNPLTAIVGYSDLLASHERLDSEPRDFARKILAQARRTKSLVQNLLTFAKQTPLQRRAVNVNAIVSHALQLHELDFAGKNVQIVCRMQADLPSVVGDENQLLQVFLHIMNNGVDAMLEHPGGGTLSVSTEKSDDRVLWRCSDTGPGVPDPIRIFDPFFTTKPIGKGTGLGLSASYGIIRDHGGEITCANLPEGGASFVISLPAARTEEEAAAAAVGSASA